MAEALPGTWRCHVCGRERPDELISVRKVEREIGRYAGRGPAQIVVTVRHCNDDILCISRAPAVVERWLRKAGV